MQQPIFTPQANPSGRVAPLLSGGRLGLAAALLLAAATAGAERVFVDDPEPIVPRSVQDGKKWEEGTAQLPAWPQDANLVEVRLDDPAPRFRFLIDTRSLSTGSDGVVRYTLIAESGSGTRNVSFEGLRCTPKGRYKVYAYGIDDRFEPASGSEEWRPIDERGADSVHDELWRHYLCVPRLFEARAKKDQIRMLKNGRVPAINTDRFLTP